MDRTTWKLIAGAAVAGLVVGLLAGVRWATPTPGRLDPAAPEHRQADGSLVLERKPDAQAKPAAAVPKGGTVERLVSVTVQPRATRNASGSNVLPDLAPSSVKDSSAKYAAGGQAIPDTMFHVEHPAAADSARPCPPVRVDLALVRMPDQTRRVVASSPDGDILNGVDIPVEAPPVPKAHPWTVSAVAVLHADGTRHYGGLVTRSFGPIALGAGAFQGGGMVTAGIRF